MKRLLVLFVLLFTVLFSYTVVAQEFRSLKKDYEVLIPEKIQNPVLDPLPAGTYSVGTGGYFATIQAAFDKLSIDGIAGEVILELTDNLYTAAAVQFGFSLNGPIPGAGPNSRVTIKPALNKNVTIEGNNESLLYLINTSYVTFDGVSLTGSTTLTIHALQNSAYVFNDALDFINNSDHNIIQNITFIVEDNTRASGSGFWFTQTGSAPDSNLIQNNYVKKAGDAFFVVSASASLKGKDNVIRGNQIGSETDSLISLGIEVAKCENAIVESNIVQNLKVNMSGTERVLTGVLSTMSSGTIIRNNVIRNFRAISGYSTSGIFLGSDGTNYGTNNLVYNNMIYDINSTSAQSNSRVTGIESWYQNDPKIYYNSVYLSGTGSQHLGSAALYIGGVNSNVDAKNNIFINTRDESPYCASAIYDYSSANLTSDYNDLYYDDTNNNNCLVRIGGTDYHTLAGWQATGKDFHSLNESVNFVSQTDLHINNNYNTLLDGSATPIAGITLDFDGETRNTTMPDIGADEFELSSNASNWQMQNSNFPAGVMVMDFSAASSQVCWAIGYNINGTPYGGYIRTTDGGNNWVCDTIASGWNGYLMQIFAFDADTAYIVSEVASGGNSKGIYKTTDGGTTWNRQNAYNTSLYGACYIHFFDAQNGVVIGDPDLETYTTSNGGLTWNPVIMPPTISGEYGCWNSGNGITAAGDNAWFSSGARVFKSTDKGYTWSVILTEPQYSSYWPCIKFQDSQTGIYSLKLQGALTHIYRKTTDGGVTWNTLSNSILDDLAPTGMQHIPGTLATYVVSGGMPQGMKGLAVTYDAGESWTLIENFGHNFVEFPSNEVGWGSDYSTNSVQKYVGPRITIVEEEVIDLIPTGYSLSQNYPNPFNPSTTFRYSIPTQSKVVIKVYDILGNEIATLMDEEKTVGTYELTWNAANLSSGIYFYQLTSGDFIQTRKMILIK